MSQVKSFNPVVDEDSRVLILGSMPGVQSLKKQQYYAHQQNHFWRIMFGMFEKPVETQYDRRIAFLKSKGIGLWDTLESCHRPGSSDSDITNEKPNNFKKLFQN